MSRKIMVGELDEHLGRSIVIEANHHASARIPTARARIRHPELRSDPVCGSCGEGFTLSYETAVHERHAIAPRHSVQMALVDQRRLANAVLHGRVERMRTGTYAEL